MNWEQLLEGGKVSRLRGAGSGSGEQASPDRIWRGGETRVIPAVIGWIKWRSSRIGGAESRMADSGGCERGPVVRWCWWCERDGGDCLNDGEWN